MPTLTTFRTNVSKTLGLENTTGGDQTQIDGYLNEGVLEILRQTNVYVDKGTMSLTPAVTDYTLDSGIMRILSLYITGSDSRVYWLEHVSLETLLDMRRRNTDLTDTVRYFALAGSNTFVVYPTPASADTITIYYVPYPTAMSDGAHDPSNATYGGIPREYHRGIELYALWRLADLNDDKSSEQGERYRALFEGFVASINSTLSRKGGPMPRANTNRPRRRYLRNRNDIYP